MKRTFVFAILVMILFFSAFHLTGQVDDWYIKGLQAKDLQEKINYFTESIKLNPTADAYWHRFKAMHELDPGEEAYNDMYEAMVLDYKIFFISMRMFFRIADFTQKLLMNL